MGSFAAVLISFMDVFHSHYGKTGPGYVHNILAVRFRLQLSFCNVFDCHGYPFLVLIV